MLRIDPALPLMWTSPTTVRIGVQAAVAVIEDVDDETAVLLDRMRRGVVDTEPAVMLGRRRATRLLTAIAPALEQAARPRLAVQVLGVGPVASTVRSVLADDGHRVVSRQPQLVVPVADWRLPEPERQRLLQRDQPHLAVTIGDQRIDVGPYTVPGRSACTRCAALADPAGFVPLTPPAVAEVPVATIAQAVAAVAVRVNLAAWQRLALGSGARIALRTGELTEMRWEAVEACGCRALPGTATATARGARRLERATVAACDEPS